jgi:folate-dependent phosphoribosylglycinamide formyltransferase PurN
MNKPKIVLLGGKGISTNIVFHAINNRYGIVNAIVEKKESTITFLKRRIKRLGLSTVCGQLLFQLFIAKPLGILSKKRIGEIINENLLDNAAIPKAKLIETSSVNSAETIEILKKIDPDIIIVNGTRIISKRVISSVNCKLINTHAGITPKYRGVHGAYWALVNNDKENCGVTVHFVDEGIDTGNIIYQNTIICTKKDNFSTYPFLQLAEGIKLLNNAVGDYCENNITIIQPSNSKSVLWYHPTIWQYLFYRIRGIA